MKERCCRGGCTLVNAVLVVASATSEASSVSSSSPSIPLSPTATFSPSAKETCFKVGGALLLALSATWRDAMAAAFLAAFFSFLPLGSSCHTRCQKFCHRHGMYPCTRRAQ